MYFITSIGYWVVSRRSAIGIKETLPRLELFIPFSLLFGHFDLFFCGFSIYYYDYYCCCCCCCYSNLFLILIFHFDFVCVRMCFVCFQYSVVNWCECVWEFMCNFCDMFSSILMVRHEQTIANPRFDKWICLSFDKYIIFSTFFYSFWDEDEFFYNNESIFQFFILLYLFKIRKII